MIDTLTVWALAAAPWLFAVGALAWGVFAVRYALVNGWRRTPEGRHLMRTSTLLALVLGATLLFRAVPLPLPVMALIQVVLILGVDIEGIARNILLTRAQRRNGDSETG